MKQHIDKAYQAAISIAAVLARTNGRSNTAAAEVLSDAKVIFEEGFIDVIGHGDNAETSEAIERFKSAMLSSIEIAATRTGGGRIRPDSVIADAKVFYTAINKNTGDCLSETSVLKRNAEELIVSEGTAEFVVQPVRFEKNGTVAGTEAMMMPQAWGIYQRMRDGSALHLADIAAGAKDLARNIASYFKEEFLAGRFDPMAAITAIEVCTNTVPNQGDRGTECVFDLNPQLVESSFINRDGTVHVHPWSSPTILGLPVLEIDGVAWSRYNIEQMIADDPVTGEEFGPVWDHWDNEVQYIYQVRTLAEKVYRDVKEQGLTPVSAWEGIKNDGINGAFRRAVQATQRPPRQ